MPETPPSKPVPSDSSSSPPPASPTPPRKPTAFVTHDHAKGRAPSAYYVETKGGQLGDSRRARQEHGGGPTVTKQKSAVHAFASDKQQIRAVHANVKATIAREDIDAQDALRMEILDGMASPAAAFGDAHEEAFPGGVRKGNPHRSGGLVEFAEQGSDLADFDKVKKATRALKKGVHGASPITDSTTHLPTPASSQFNQASVHAQQDWAQGLLSGARPIAHHDASDIPLPAPKPVSNPEFIPPPPATPPPRHSPTTAPKRAVPRPPPRPPKE